MQKKEKATAVLDLNDGACHSLTAALWKSWTEAAAVSIERFHAPPPPQHACTVSRGEVDLALSVVWPPTDATMRASHANEIDATEMGAYAVAIAAVHAVDGWRAVKRAQHATGADLIMAKVEDPDGFVKLEVSGVAAGTGPSGHGALRTRLKQKQAQVRVGDLARPGFAAVVGFEALRVLISAVTT